VINFGSFEFFASFLSQLHYLSPIKIGLLFFKLNSESFLLGLELFKGLSEIFEVSPLI